MASTDPLAKLAFLIMWLKKKKKLPGNLVWLMERVWSCDGIRKQGTAVLEEAVKARLTSSIPPPQGENVGCPSISCRAGEWGLGPDCNKVWPWKTLLKNTVAYKSWIPQGTEEDGHALRHTTLTYAGTSSKLLQPHCMPMHQMECRPPQLILEI